MASGEAIRSQEAPGHSSYNCGVISLITPTGGRPEAFALLERYIRAQTYTGPLEWIVVDDGEQPTRTTCGQKVIRRKPYWSKGDPPTLAANLYLGFEAASGEKLLVIEDDECYLPNYLNKMAAALNGHALAGQAPARYFNVQTRQYRVLTNAMHASLCQTGMCRELADAFMVDLACAKSPFLDIPLWRKYGTAGLARDEFDVVSMKSMPGRPGIGAGHRAAGAAWTRDLDCKVLQTWIGERYLSYLRYYQPHALRSYPSTLRAQHSAMVEGRNE